MKCKIEFSNEADLRDSLAVFLCNQGELYARTEVELPNHRRVDIVVVEHESMHSWQMTELIECKQVLDAYSVETGLSQLLDYSKSFKSQKTESPKLLLAGLGARYVGKGEEACMHAELAIDTATRQGVEVLELNKWPQFYEWVCIEAYVWSQKNRKEFNDQHVREATYRAIAGTWDFVNYDRHNSIYDYYWKNGIDSSVDQDFDSI